MSLALDIIVIIMIIMYSFMCSFSTEIGAHSPSQRTKHRTNPRACTLARARTHTHTHTHTHMHAHSHKHTHTHTQHTYNTHTHTYNTHTQSVTKTNRKKNGVGGLPRRAWGFQTSFSVLLLASIDVSTPNSALNEAWVLTTLEMRAAKQ